MQRHTHRLNKNIYLRLTSNQANCFQLNASANIIFERNDLNVNLRVILKHSSLYRFGMSIDMFWKNAMSQESSNASNKRK